MEVRSSTAEVTVVEGFGFEAGDSHGFKVSLSASDLSGSAVELAEYLMDLAARVLEAELVYGEVGARTQGVATSHGGFEIDHPHNASHLADLIARNNSQVSQEATMRSCRKHGLVKPCAGSTNVKGKTGTVVVVECDPSLDHCPQCGRGL